MVDVSAASAVPSDARGESIRVFILGSCVSRDAFGDDASSAGLIVQTYLARTSLATLASAPAPLTPAIDQIRSAFQKRMVKADHERQALAVARSGAFDVMLLDLIDERFHLLRRPDGAIVTYSNEYAAVAPRPLAGALITSGSAEHERLWRAGLAQLVAALRESNSLHKVRVNAVFWASADVSGRAIEGFTADQIEKANAFLGARYLDLEAQFGQSAFIRYPSELLVSDPAHRWGVSAFHYGARLYAETLQQLMRISPSPTAVEVHELARNMPAPPFAAHARQATLRADGQGLTVTVSGQAATGLEFAYYLFRDQSRVGAIWYSPRTQVQFPCPTIAGDYYVSVFERHRPTAKVTRYRTPAIAQPDPSRYSTARWSRKVEFYPPDRPVAVADGVHRFIEDGPTSLDFLLQGFAAAPSGTPIIVCFGGAVSAREKKIGPFFSGLSIGKDCGLPLIAVADPTLTRASNVALGWYAGHDQCPALYLQMARRLDEISRATDAPLIMIGGSGGGFASLATLCGLSARATALVWNPQTSITKYHITHVHRYVQNAFPEAARRTGIDRLPPNRTRPDQLAECLDQAGVLHDLTRVMPVSRAPVLYLQNASDEHHIEKHLKPLLASRGLEIGGRTGVVGGDGLSVCVSDWGDGHLPPPPAAIGWLIKQVAAGVAVDAIAAGVQSGEMHRASGIDSARAVQQPHA